MDLELLTARLKSCPDTRPVLSSGYRTRKYTGLWPLSRSNAKPRQVVGSVLVLQQHVRAVTPNLYSRCDSIRFLCELDSRMYSADFLHGPLKPGVKHGTCAVAVWRRGLSRLVSAVSGGANRGEATAPCSWRVGGRVDHVPGVFSDSAFAGVSVCALAGASAAMESALRIAGAGRCFGDRLGGEEPWRRERGGTSHYYDLRCPGPLHRPSIPDARRNQSAAAGVVGAC